MRRTKKYVTYSYMTYDDYDTGGRIWDYEHDAELVHREFDDDIASIAHVGFDRDPDDVFSSVRVER